METIKGKRFSLTLLLLAAAGFFTLLSAQTFEEAKQFAFNGQRSKARAICRVILMKGFDSDVATLMGRTYAWDKQYDSARVVLQEVLVQSPENSDVLSALADVEYWNDRYPQALEYCNRILVKNPENETVQFQKARILNSADQYDESVAVLENLLKKNSANSDALRLLEKVRLELIKNKITINYSYDYFNNSAYKKEPWQLVYLQYARKTALGTVIGRVNYANRFGSDALQFEADAYPRIGENDYLYFNYGFSDMSGFPNQRGGFEWYHSFPKSFEGSLGSRLLYFQGSKRVIIYTGSFGKYFGNYWFSLRPFITPGSDGTSVSTYLLVRRYFSDPENYIGIRLGVGSSPDERRLLLNDPNQAAHLKSQSVKLDYNHIFGNRWIFSTGVAFANEEYWSPVESKIKSGSIYSFELGFAYLF
ncbi:MAG TPA: YaiO family outer membrane beta-barrel protein [Prolixibacteraceae bacterium]